MLRQEVIQRVIAVLGGTGQQGRGIVQRLARASYAVTVGSRDARRAAATIAEWPAEFRRIDTADYGSAMGRADVIVLAVPFETVGTLIEQHAARLKHGAVVLDVTVPLSFSSGKVALMEVPEGSAAEHIRARLPATAGIATAFKTVPAQLLTHIDRSLDCDDFVCGDAPDARAKAVEIVQAVEGLRAIDVGPLARARSIEHLTLLAVGVNRRHKIHEARFRMVGI